MDVIFPDDCVLLQHVKASSYKAKWVMNKMLIWPPNPIKRPWDVLDTHLIDGAHTSQLTALQGSSANLSMPVASAHPQGSGGVHASTGQGPTHYETGRHFFMSDWRIWTFLNKFCFKCSGRLNLIWRYGDCVILTPGGIVEHSLQTN